LEDDFRGTNQVFLRVDDWQAASIFFSWFIASMVINTLQGQAWSIGESLVTCENVGNLSAGAWQLRG